MNNRVVISWIIRLRTPTIKSTETDWNRDGKLDWVDMTIEMPADDHQAIYGVQVYLLFDVKLFVSTSLFILRIDFIKYFKIYLMMN